MYVCNQRATNLLFAVAGNEVYPHHSMGGLAIVAFGQCPKAGWGKAKTVSKTMKFGKKL